MKSEVRSRFAESALSLLCSLTTHRDSLQFARDQHPQSFLTRPQNLLSYPASTNASMTTRRTPLMDISNNDVTSTPVATGSRRKSGRAVKVPEKFVPDAPSSQQGSASAKRKRGGEDAENDASDIEEDEEESDATVESAAEDEVREIRRKAKTTKKPAAKKPKVNGTATHDKEPQVKLPARPKKTKKVAIADKSAEGLYG
jgi:cohesin complex subunit SA-1/2